MARFATIEEFAPYAGIKDLGKADTDLMEKTIGAVEGTWERWLNRSFAPLPALVNGVDNAAPVTKTFRTRGRRSIRVPDLRTVVAVTLDGLAWTENWDYTLDGDQDEPSLFLTLDRSYSIARGSAGTLSVTGRWGYYPAAPTEVVDAMLRHAGRMWARRDARYSDTLATPDGSQFLWTQALQDDVRMVFEGFRTRRFVIA